MVSAAHSVSDDEAFYILMDNKLHIIDVLLLVDSDQESSRVL